MLFLAMIARDCNWHDGATNVPIPIVSDRGQSDGLEFGGGRRASGIGNRLDRMRSRRGRVVLPLLALAVVLACHPKTPPTPHSVTLMWRAPNLPAKVSLVGYNVYRWTTSDSRHLRIATQVSGPPYEDRQVVSGETYFYAVTAVDQSGRESRLSENIQATIP